MDGRVGIRANAGAGIDVEAFRERALGLGVTGWVRPTGEIHAEGPREAVDALLDGLDTEAAKVEGHEQFGIRGVSAGRFRVAQDERGYVVCMEVDGAMRCWALTKEPTLDPAVKRFAIEAGEPSGGTTWDEGTYEQGGRVAWPEAIERGHAVFVLHGEKLRGGFALQRTGRGWLLVKRKDDEARPAA